MKIPRNQSMPWQSFINNQGDTVVFNLTMGSSNLTDAMHLFGSEVEVSLFESEGKMPELEAFFFSTKMGGIGASVILSLMLDQKCIERLNNNIKKSMVMPSGVRKTTFSLTAEVLMFNLKIKSLTFIPKANLSKEVIVNLFGEPSRIELSIQGVSYWYYPTKGLRIIDDENKKILEFYNKIIQ
ncbi:hypothetical protein [Candidatus Ruthturnera calyptogenae]|nr:hypothetical protein [Candidatus Ruthturnera calyptogenae]